MKIKQVDNKVTISSLEAGEVFTYNSLAYVRTNPDITAAVNAVRLSDGGQIYLTVHTRVTHKPKATLQLEGDL